MNHNGPSYYLPSPRLPSLHPPTSNSIPAFHAYLSQNIPQMKPDSSWDNNHRLRINTKHGHGRSSSSGSSGWDTCPGPERSASRWYPGRSNSPTGGPNTANGHGPGHGDEDSFSFPSLGNNSAPAVSLPNLVSNVQFFVFKYWFSYFVYGEVRVRVDRYLPRLPRLMLPQEEASAFGASSNQLSPPPGGLTLNGNTSNARGSYDIHPQSHQRT
ncbi:hypothetical protein D9757_009483 [Collybiopsis confluens]|uniref:Uncharacterized protein n=1 Tax=Collybiopsis confluens TaxID=2823264 RepID=A0A8H5H4Y0_9AGAR|nr:hypothetical protein D9757_009483 [Collybiopsis confluens]